MDILLIQKNILAHTLPHIPFDGWSQAALELGTESAGLTATDLARAFPRGAREAVQFFIREADAAMTEIPLTPEMRLHEKIEALILGRLAQNFPQREATRRAVAFLALPQNADLALETLYRTTDAMWRLAGDQPTDFSFYTKRLTLAATYSATLLYWLSDNSENQMDTMHFLKRRMSNLQRFHKFRQSLPGLPGNFLRNRLPAARP